MAAHIRGLYDSRKAFTEVLCDDKIKIALRNKVRAVERRYKQGEEVFYRREGDSQATCGAVQRLLLETNVLYTS